MTAASASQIGERIRNLDAISAKNKLTAFNDAEIAAALAELRPGQAVDILQHFPPERRDAIAAAAPPGGGEQWLVRTHYPESTVGRLMEATPLQFTADTTVQAATDANKENAVEGAEADLASLRARRGAHEHRRHLLEARLSDLAPANP